MPTPDDLKRLDDRLREWQDRHPILSWVVASGIALGILTVAMMLRAFLEWLTKQ
jgi:hypothetical protein